MHAVVIPVQLGLEIQFLAATWKVSHTSLQLSSGKGKGLREEEVLNEAQGAE